MRRILGIGPTPLAALAAAGLLLLSACLPLQPGAPTAPADPSPAPAPAAPPSASPGPARLGEPLPLEALPGWAADPLAQLWPALRRACAKPPPAWQRLCAQALLADPADDAAARYWLAQRLVAQPVLNADGSSGGLLTGYFEPLLDATRRPHADSATPLHSLPPRGSPSYTRQQFATLPEAQALLRGREIAWLADPLDAMLLQVQGSGRLRLLDEPGQPVVRLAYAGHNGQAYRSVGRWLVDNGQMAAPQASWPAIKDWARRNPARLQDLLNANPRVVFFREEPLPDASVGPRGAQGLALTPGRSIAVDPASIPLGSLVWLDSTEPLSSTPLQRLVLAQDTGSAIVGAVRADYFWGWGEDALAQAGRMRQPLRLWLLRPR